MTPDSSRKLLMRTLEELVEQAELVDHLERRGMHRVAAEIAQEVGVLLEDDDVDAGARHEEAEHHAGGAAADDRELGADGLGSACDQSSRDRPSRKRERSRRRQPIGIGREFG